MNDSEKTLISDKKKKASVTRRLLANLTKNEETGCVEWLSGALANGGYGSIAIGRGLAPLRAHRAAWILENGEIPDGMYVCHSCDNPRCCNTEHLFLGSPKDNMDDKTSKGRGSRPPVHLGESHHNATMSFEDVQYVRSSSESKAELAKKFGVSYQTIWRIQSGKTRLKS